MKTDKKIEDSYKIELKNERYIVWRLVEGNQLRQGSHSTYDKAFNAMSLSMERMG